MRRKSQTTGTGGAVPDRRRFTRAFVALATIASTAIAGAADPVSAVGPIVVNSTADLARAEIANACNGVTTCTLRAAIQLANSTEAHDTIVLAAGATYELTRDGAGEDGGATGDLDIYRPTTIEGNGATVEQTRADRVLHVVGASTSLTIEDLTLSGGTVGAGAGLLQTAGTGDLRGVRVTANSAGPTGDGGGIWLGTGVTRFWMTRVVLDANSARAGGGLYSRAADLIVRETTVTANVVTGVGRAGAGVYLSGVTSGIEASSIIDNEGGSGVYVGAATPAPWAGVTNSTIVGNDGPGLEVRAGQATAIHVTSVDNVGSGVTRGGSGQLTLQRSIVGGSNPPGQPSCTGGGIVSGGYNVTTDATCAPGGTDLVTANLVLDGLGNHGGATPTMPPRAASDTVDLIPAAACTEFSDQRAVRRPLGVGCDPGAAEFGALVTVYGQEGSFRRLGDLDTDGDGLVTNLTGDTIALDPVDGWQFRPGTTAYFPAITDEGQVALATMTADGNNLTPSMQGMSFALLDPAAPAGPALHIEDVVTRNVDGSAIVPEIDEASQHTAGWTLPAYQAAGGADISDVCRADTPDGQRIFGVSASPFKNWNAAGGDAFLFRLPVGSHEAFTIELRARVDNEVVVLGSGAVDPHDAILPPAEGGVDAPGAIDLPTLNDWDVRVLLLNMARTRIPGAVIDDVHLNAAPRGGANDPAADVALITFRGSLADEDFELVVTGGRAGHEPTVEPYDVAGGSRTRRFGTFPSLVAFDGAGTVDEVRTFTDDELHAARDQGMEALADAAYPRRRFFNQFGDRHRESKAMAECAVVPRPEAIGDDLVITQYGITDDPDANDALPAPRAGRLLVVGSDGTLRAFLQLPPTETLRACSTPVDHPCVPPGPQGSTPCDVVHGCEIDLSPRDVAVGDLGDGTFAVSVIYDATVRNPGGAHWPVPFPLQVFRYDPAAAPPDRLEAMTNLMVPRGSTTGTTRYNQATFAAGALIAAVSDNTGQFTSRRVDVFDLGAATLDGCPLPDLQALSWSTVPATCERADLSTWSAAGSASTVPVRTAPQITSALDFDAERGLLLVTSQVGIMRVFRTTADGDLIHYRDVDLGGQHLRFEAAGEGVEGTVCDPENSPDICRSQWVRKGVIDVDRGIYYLVYHGFDRNDAVPDDTVRQYVFAVDLDLLDAPCAAPFPDVGADHPFCHEIAWASGTGITDGYPDGGFHPGEPVTRQAMAAFLHGFGPVGSYTPPATSAFSDVAVDHPFFAEIHWLVARGITTGYDDGTFKPGAVVTRQAMAAFIYRFMGAPDGLDPECTGAPFSDVATGDPFCGEIAWARAHGVLNGYDDGTFRPNADITRQAAAAILYRLPALPGP